MSVYVDNMRAPFGRLIMCHMIADTDDELHAMADRIGVARRWHQGDHYDIALSKRALAVAAGAVEITHRQCGIMAVYRRRTGRLPSLDEVPGLLADMAERVRARLIQAPETPPLPEMSKRGDHPDGVTPAFHLWLPYRAGGPGWKICKWCGLTRSPEEQRLFETAKQGGD